EPKSICNARPLMYHQAIVFAEAPMILPESSPPFGQTQAESEVAPTLDPARASDSGSTLPARPAFDVAVSIPGFEIIGELGRGGMGVVYQARHSRLNRLVALKMARGGERPDAKELIRFLAEAEAVAAIKHANVVQVYDYGEHGGQPYM